MHWNIIYSYKLQGICLYFCSYFDWPKVYYHTQYAKGFPSIGHCCLCFVYVRNYQVAVMYITEVKVMLKANFERVMKIILFNFKSKFVPKVMFSTTNKIAIYCQQILTFLGLISSFHHYFHLNVSHRTFLHHSSLCSHASVHFLKFLTLLCTKTLLK
jgi:hypothetical protein